MPFSYFTVATYAIPYGTGDGLTPGRMAVGDFNGDGFFDVIVTRAEQNQTNVNQPRPLQILLGDGVGGYVDGTATMFPGGVPETSAPNQVIVADFNGDGRDDVFIVDPGADQPPFPGYHNTLLLSSGATGFVDATGTHMPTLPDAYSFTGSAADIDGDGDLDLIVNTAQYTTLFNSGDGHFTADDGRTPPFLGQIDAWNCEDLADMDNDGDLDLVVGGRIARIWRNDGDGTFLDVVPLPPPPFSTDQSDPTYSNMDSIVAFDVNGDGLLDVISATNDSTYQNTKLQIFIQHAGFTFVDETAAHTGFATFVGFIREFFVFDVNADGQDDLIAYEGKVVASQNGISFLMHDGDQLIRINSGVDTDPLFDTTNSEISAPFDGDGDGLFEIFAGPLPGGPYSTLEFTGLALVQTGDAAANGMMGAGADANTLSGLGGDDVLFGAAGTDTLNGGLGNDYLSGGADADTLNAAAGADTLNGGLGNDALNGLAGADTLNGGGGADVMTGGDGNDTYFVNSGADVTSETSALGGIDTVRSAVTRTLGANLENLTLTGASPINGTGNSLGNILTGNALANTLSGLGGADTLNGLGGADVMEGGDGNDTYIVGNTGDVTTETSALGGIDLVKSSVTRALGAHLENLTLIGGSAVNGTGNGLNNTILGNSGANTLAGASGADTLGGAGGADTLNGGLGNDTLIGGANSDVFVFNSALAANLDVITDYNVAADTVRLENAIFTGLAVGVLSGAAFHIGASAADSSDRIIYNSATGALFFDADGNGGAAQIQFATLSAGLALTAADFVVI